MFSLLTKRLIFNKPENAFVPEDQPGAQHQQVLQEKSGSAEAWLDICGTSLIIISIYKI
jgi:hypothetical protein